ncbi:hypothetical protein [Rathayibacter sp. VKM Ac-2760]|uniref:hypothetical protein n=1 Tax=Rathayibacter sp. VKM Ac-2760 TaxID=2609253 RepID=UPI001317E091|nr:hypothetical protein [Rathayibacter sp. VKM Ac-2760]QHC58321.1 hypothetical protein GSU72_07000 [Rathayibacter sp. VKM Ac-2760]
MTSPLALVVLVTAVSSGVWFLTQGGVGGGPSGAPTVRIGGFVLGLSLILVALTAQRGSPLRLQPADVSWVLQSPSGPRIVLMVHASGTAAIAFVSTSAASATALVLRGGPVAWGVLSGCAMAAVLLLVRATSLTSHLLGRTIRPSRRRYALACVLTAGVVWISLWAQSLIVGEDSIGSASMSIAGLLFEVILVPEASGVEHASAAIGVLLLSSIAVGLLVRRAGIFIEPAVEESILANQLTRILSGESNRTLAGRGYAVGRSSWVRWPDSAVGAVLASHLAQARRRRWQEPRTALALLAVAVLSSLVRDDVPMPLSGLLLVLILALPGPSQATAQDLDHQHLPLADVSIARAGFAGVGLHALISLTVSLPAVVLWASVYLHGVGWGLLAILPLALCCMNAGLTGVGSRAFSDLLLGRVVVAVALSLLPVAGAASNLARYDQGHDALRVLVTLFGVLLISCLLSSGLAWAVLESARPARSSRAPAV